MRRSLRNRLAGAVALAWGVLVVSRGLLEGFASTDGSYRAGQIGAYLVAWVLVVLGASALLRRTRTEW